MSTHNICYHGEIRKVSVPFVLKNALSVAMVPLTATYEKLPASLNLI